MDFILFKWKFDIPVMQFLDITVALAIEAVGVGLRIRDLKDNTTK